MNPILYLEYLRLRMRFRLLYKLINQASKASIQI